MYICLYSALTSGCNECPTQPARRVQWMFHIRSLESSTTALNSSISTLQADPDSGTIYPTASNYHIRLMNMHDPSSTVHLFYKFHDDRCNRFMVTLLTDKQREKQTDRQTDRQTYIQNNEQTMNVKHTIISNTLPAFSVRKRL